MAQGPAYFLKVRAGANPTRGAAPGLGEATRRAAVEGFMDLFAPGNIVDLALASDTTGPPGG